LGYAVQKQGALNASLQWVHNLPWYPEAADDTRFNAARKGARSDYSFVRINVAGTAALSSAWSLVGRLEGQSSDQPLVVAEQFGAGGANSVRGYPERVLSGDSGAVASLELRAPWGFWREAKEDGPELQLGFFADGGSVSYQGGGSCATGKTQCDIWSTGVGAFWRVTPQTVVRADVARAGVEAGDTRAGDWTLHVNLNHNF
jgi:hemolysin activation/secretion protein